MGLSEFFRAFYEIEGFIRGPTRLLKRNDWRREAKVQLTPTRQRSTYDTGAGSFSIKLNDE